MLEAGSEVRSIDNPGRTGTITNRQPRQKPSGRYYQVRWADGGIDHVHEQQLEAIVSLDAEDPYALAEQGKYGRDNDLRRNLTFVHLAGRLANLVYAMGITNTDFYAHQYRPLLALLDSPINGLLIADEVGLGKTIESGLIWTELRARFDMRLLVVICPAMLREKWRDELEYRFGVESRIVNAAELHEELAKESLRTSEGRALIASYQGIRPPRSWRGGSRSTASSTSKDFAFADFLYERADEEPLVDMVIFDEAHYMRNSDSATWQMGELLRSISHYQIMLSATPINLKNLDLFNLLRLLDPDQFGDEVDFEEALEANRPLVAARDATLNYQAKASEIRAHLEEAIRHPRLASSRQLRSVLDNPPTDEKLDSREYRVKLADTLERLSLIAHVITRTRKKDVQKDRIQRKIHREAVEMSAEERKAYELVTQTIRSYALERDISDGFLLATPQRQITSCPYAILEAWRTGGFQSAESDEDAMTEIEDLGDDDTAENPFRPLRSLLAATVPREINFRELRENDSKFIRLRDVLTNHLEKNPEEKVIIFTSFRTTARYLVERLSESSINSTLIWGNKNRSKHDVIAEFRDSSTSRVLVSTEVAAEGVDLQFCRVLINYDLPWNPTRIEQRIGRIDRLGQLHPLIHVWNLFFDDTIDQRVVTRLLDRLRIFEEALGESEAVVGEEIRKLETRLLSRNPTPEEELQEFEQTALALENIRHQREELEKNAAHMMAHGQLVIERIEAADKLSKRVTEQDLLIYVQDYLSNYWTGYRFSQNPQDPLLVEIDLPGELRATLESFLTSEGMRGHTVLASTSRKCRFLNKISQRPKRGEEIIHQFHPLIRFISRDIRERKEHFYRLIAVQLQSSDVIGNVPSGDYVFYIRLWSFSGIRDDEILAIAAADLQTGQRLDSDQADLLIQAARLNGKAWHGAGGVLQNSIVQDRMGALEDVLDDAHKSELFRKRNENADRAQFQRDSIQRHLSRKIPVFEQTRDEHFRKKREPLAKATQGRIDKLKGRMMAKLARVDQNAQVRPSSEFICAGVVRVL